MNDATVSLVVSIGSWSITTEYPKGAVVSFVFVSVEASPMFPAASVRVTERVINPSPKPLRSNPVI